MKQCFFTYSSELSLLDIKCLCPRHYQGLILETLPIKNYRPYL